MIRELNPEQKRAAESADSQVVISAAAGSGKTEVIVHRYIRLVQVHGLLPDEIVAVTYTKRAAAKMKHRIVDRLRQLELMDAARRAETGPILTIHSFYERLLRENAIWAGGSPDFEIITDYDAEIMLENAIRTALVSPETSDGCIQKFVEHVSGASSWGAIELDSELVKQVKSLITQAQNAGWSAEELDSQFPDSRHIECAYAAVFEDNWSVDERTFGEKIAEGSSHPVKQSVEFDREIDLLLGLIKLSVQAWRNLDNAMTSESRYDFHRLEVEACKLLDKSSVVRDRIRAQYKAVLVDESQDANLTQARFFDSLQPAYKLTVGDGDQAIYSFRGGNRDTFESLCDGALNLVTNHRSAPGILNFVNEVFRKRWGDNYKPMRAPGEHPSADMSGVEILQLVDRAEATGISEFVERMIAEGTSPRSIAILTRNGSSASKVAARLEAKGIRYQNFNNKTSLFQIMESRDVANLLAACTDVENDYYLACLLRSPFAEVSLDGIIQLTQKPNLFDQLGIIEFLHSEDRKNVDEFLDWFTEMRRYSDRFSAFEIISRAFARSPYLHRVARKIGGEQSVANARKLLKIAIDMPEMSPLQLAARFRRLQTVDSRTDLAQLYEPTEDAVQIMTVHKAKGLEFDNVIVFPDIKPDSRIRDFYCDLEKGVIMSKFLKTSRPFQSLLKSIRAKEQEESWRLTYVAFTRARHRLIIGRRDDPKSLSEAALIGFGKLPGVKRHTLERVDSD